MNPEPERTLPMTNPFSLFLDFADEFFSLGFLVLAVPAVAIIVAIVVTA